MTVDERREITDSADSSDTGDARRARRVAQLYATDPQFQAAKPRPEVIEKARRTGLRLAPILQTFMDGYADRPALGQRARELTTDPATGRTTARLLPSFDTVTYRELWARVRAVATAWRHDNTHPVNPGDFVATLGFTSADYVTIDLVCAYLGLVSVPLQHNAPVSQLEPIIAEVEPRVLAVGAAYLDLAVESALASSSLRHLVVFDYDPGVDNHRENLARARARLEEAEMRVVVEPLSEVIERGQTLPAEPSYTGGTDDRLAMILYTSGTTGTPKGAMYTENMLAEIWRANFVVDCQTPGLDVTFLPLSHFAGRLPLAGTFLTGGTVYFVSESDLSTLLEDWALVRPTRLVLVPRVVEMMFHGYRAAVDQLVLQGTAPDVAEAQAAAHLREQVLGGRVLGGLCGSAPLAIELAVFLESCLDVHVEDCYGLTEVGLVTRDGRIERPAVFDYRLIDVPDLGYFTTDKPSPRGELLIRSATAMPGYYKHPDVTAEVFDDDGYYHTGDVMAEIGPDQLVYVDRRKNVLKLAQGEFVAVARLEAVFAGAAMVREIFLYGSSERSYLLAVIVPTPDALELFADDQGAVKAALRESLRQTAKVAELQSYEVPVDFLIETTPFSAANGLLSGVGKNRRPNLGEHYGQRLEQLYADLAAAQADELSALRRTARDQPVLDTVIRAATAVLGSTGADVHPGAHFTDLGGDSLSALTLSNLLQELLAVEVSVGVIVNPASNLNQLAHYIEAEQQSESKRPTFSTIHGNGTTEIRASDLRLDKFIDAKTLADAKTLRTTGEPRTVLLTGANGYLGRFLALELLHQLANTGGKLICIVRGRDAAAARARLEEVFDSGDPQLRRRFRELAADHLEVVAGDIGQPNLGLSDANWERLTDCVDLVVHPAALVNHLLPYDQLFAPNVVGTAEVIRLAITSRVKPISYLSTVAVVMQVNPADFIEDGDIRDISPVRSVDDTYANGYGNSKWAGEVLLREAFDLCTVPVTVFRSDMILAHSRYVGQLNVPDSFTRLVLSILATGVAPRSFYQTDGAGNRLRAHYDGLPADFVAEAVATLGANATQGFRSFDVMNPHDDGVSLDTFVDWLIAAGHDITRIDDYQQWLARFETALRALPDKQRQHTVLPLLDAYRQPQMPFNGAPAPTEAFHAAVRAAKIGADNDIPHLSAQLIDKYVHDLHQLGLLDANVAHR